MPDHAAAELQRELEKLRKINRALMDRVERNMNLQKGGFSLFQAAAGLEGKVRERTIELQHAMAELERSNRELKLAKDAADAASKAKSEFLATMSHEIRTPMNGVFGMAELLAGTELSASQQHQVGAIRRSAKTLLSIINDILDFSKVEAGRLELECIDFDLRDLLEDAVELIADSAHAKGLALTLHVPMDLPTRLRGDPGRLRQIVTNLVGNAIKFTDRGFVRVAVCETGRFAEGLGVRIEVTDSGIGIGADVIPALFQSFTQADGSMARRYGGTGLGLAIVRHLCTLMGGTAGVDSVLSKGSTFWCTARLSTANDSARPATASVGLAGKRALIVDDCAISRRIAAEILSSAGLEVMDPATEEEALAGCSSLARRGARVDLCFVAPGGGASQASAIHRRLAASGLIDDVRLVRIAPTREADTTDAWNANVEKPIRRAKLIAAAEAAIGLPMTDPRASTTHDDAIGSYLGGVERLRVLLVEDNEINREVAVGMLEQLGCVVEVATNGREAVSMFTKESYGLILMDCQMPEMDGFEATRALRRLEDTRGAQRTPVVALTANALAGDRERCFAAGMDAFLSKPFSKQELHEILGSSTSNRRANAASNGTSAPPSAEAGEPPVLQREALAQVRALQRPGRPDLLSRLITMFVTSSRDEVAKLERAVREGSLDEARLIAHTLKSSSANLGAQRLSAAFAEIEAEARNGACEVRLVAQMRHEHVLALQALAKEVVLQESERSSHV